MTIQVLIDFTGTVIIHMKQNTICPLANAKVQGVGLKQYNDSKTFYLILK